MLMRCGWWLLLTAAVRVVVRVVNVGKIVTENGTTRKVRRIVEFVQMWGACGSDKLDRTHRRSRDRFVVVDEKMRCRKG
jgi:hypothetical protein